MRRTGHTASIQVSEALLGRVITPLGDPLDGKASFRLPALEGDDPGASGVSRRSSPSSRK